MAKEAAAAKKAMKVVVRIMYDEEKSVMDVNVVVMMFWGGDIWEQRVAYILPLFSFFRPQKRWISSSRGYVHELSVE